MDCGWRSVTLYVTRLLQLPQPVPTAGFEKSKR